MKEANPEIEFEIKGEEFWDEISELSSSLSRFENLWPLENNEYEAYELDDDVNTDIVFPIDTWDWRLKSPDEIENTKDEEKIVKYEIENDMMISFKKTEHEFDPENFYIYRVSITPYTEDSVIKKIRLIKNMGITMDSYLKFEDFHEIAFIKSNIKTFDNTQVGSNKMFLVCTPYTIFLWWGTKVEYSLIRGAISVFREFIYKIRK